MKMATLLNQFQPAGEYRIVLDAAEFASEMNFCVLRTGNFKQGRKMLLMK